MPTLTYSGPLVIAQLIRRNCSLRGLVFVKLFILTFVVQWLKATHCVPFVVHQVSTRLLGDD